MQITHFGHSCVLVETATARLLFDPGSFSSGFEQLRDLTAVLLELKRVADTAPPPVGDQLRGVPSGPAPAPCGSTCSACPPGRRG